MSAKGRSMTKTFPTVGSDNMQAPNQGLLPTVAAAATATTPIIATWETS